MGVGRRTRTKANLFGVSDHEPNKGDKTGIELGSLSTKRTYQPLRLQDSLVKLFPLVELVYINKNIFYTKMLVWVITNTLSLP